MPSKKQTVTFDLWDYFSKFGFGDGDDGAALDEGYSYVDLAVKILNEEFKKAKLHSLKAERHDVGTMHNPCQIVLDYKGNEIGVDDGTVIGSGDKKLDVKIGHAVALSYQRFEKEAA